MIKLLDLLKEDNEQEDNKLRILEPRRSREERSKNYSIVTNKKIQDYIKNGSEGDLDLYNTPITSLPDGLEVGGYLYLNNTKITSLPNDLKVRGNLDLRNTPITSLPDGLKVGGGLNLNNTPLSKTTTKKKLKQQYPGIKGYIYY